MRCTREINAYIQNLPGANTEKEALQLDSEAILKSIEAQHGLLVERAKGIYSFSHLTFHEYFTARKLVASSRTDIFTTRLLPHLGEKRWQEVFLLTIGMVENADDLLLAMKQQIDRLVVNDDKIQQFLTWVEYRSESVNVPYKTAAVRAFYLELSRAHTRARDVSLVRALDFGLFQDLINDLDLVLGLSSARYLSFDLCLSRALDLSFDLSRAIDLSLEPSLSRALQLLQNQLPSISSANKKYVVQWWTENGNTWIEQLRELLIKHRDIGHDWKFSREQESLLHQYCGVNELLVDCLNSDCYVSRKVRQEIEIGLLLPTRQ